MGYGVKDDVEEKIKEKERKEVDLEGDGCLIMKGKEIENEEKYGENEILIVVKKGMYGKISMNKERKYKERI